VLDSRIGHVLRQFNDAISAPESIWRRIRSEDSRQEVSCRVCA
jgi:hypothetical protein